MAMTKEIDALARVLLALGCGEPVSTARALSRIATTKRSHAEIMCSVDEGEDGLKRRERLIAACDRRARRLGEKHGIRVVERLGASFGDLGILDCDGRERHIPIGRTWGDRQ